MFNKVSPKQALMSRTLEGTCRAVYGVGRGTRFLLYSRGSADPGKGAEKQVGSKEDERKVSLLREEIRAGRK